MIKNEKCSICGSSNWHDLDYMRDHDYWYQREKREEDEPVSFKICIDCGYITYDYLPDERLAELYLMERPVVVSHNLLTSARKNNYHRVFLDRSEDFKKILADPDSTYIDIGCAQGGFLMYLHDHYGVDKSKLTGNEVNKAFIGYAKNEYGLRIQSDFEDEKYDFISYYHVLEHIQWPERELKKAIEHLAEDGIMYISVPYWLMITQLFDGNLVNEFEHLYHLNHVNVFTIQSFKNLLNNAGLKILLEDYDLYAYTVIVKLDKVQPIIKENFRELTLKLETEKKSIELVKEQKHDEAIKLNPLYPDAYIMYSLNKDNMKNFESQKKILSEGLDKCPRDYKLVSQLARLHFQWDENKPDKTGFYSNNIKTAEKYLHLALELKPENDESYYFLSMIEAKYKRNYDKAVEYMRKTIEMNPSRWGESNNMIGHYWKEKEKYNL